MSLIQCTYVKTLAPKLKKNCFRACTYRQFLYYFNRPQS